jgi:hypothetical protein
MLSKILGAIWILLGLFWLIKPDALKERLKRKMNRRMKRVIYGFILVFGFLMMMSAFKAQGLLAKVIGIAGMVIAIKAIILITSKASEKMFEWWAGRSLVFFRIWALIILGIGVMLMFVQ